MNYTRVSQSRTPRTCIICSMDLTVNNTKVNKNQKISQKVLNVGLYLSMQSRQTR